MEIQNIKLRGFTGIKKGMGLDEISLNLSGVSGLVAFDGPNGHGKTTILDNLHPYACLASRTGAIQHHVFLRDSFREISFVYDSFPDDIPFPQGDHYRCLIKIDSDSGRCEGYIYKNGADHSETNGKISEYKAYISELFGSQNLFFNSVFCAQNSAKISDMTTGDLKKLFSEFLRLDRLVEFENTSKQSANIICSHIEKMAHEIGVKRYEIKKLAGAPEALCMAKRSLAWAEDEKRAVEVKLKMAEADLQRVRELAATADVTRQRIRDMEADRDRIRKEIDDDKKQTESELEKLRTKVRTISAEIKDSEQILERQDKIRKAAEREKDLTAYLDTANEAHKVAWDAYQQASVDLAEKERALDAAKRELEALKTDLEVINLQRDIAACRGKMADLDRKDPNCRSTTCSFIVGALKAKEQLPELERKLAQRRAEKKRIVTECESTVKRLAAEFEAIGQQAAEKKKAYGELNSAISDSQKKLKQLKVLAVDLPKIEVAESRKADLEKRKEEISAEGIRLRESWLARENKRLEQYNSVDKQIIELRNNMGDDLVEKIKTLEIEIEYQKKGIADQNKKISNLKAEITGLERDIEEKEAAEKNLKDLETQQSRFVTEQSEWRYLQAACGKDGLRALEIDSVAPVMSGYANDLLHGAFGPNYSIKFLTQDPETGREILDILAIREDGSETLVDNLSGGEKVWSLKALRLAQTLVAKEKSGKNFLSVMADEEDGALDVENAQSFIRLYRAFMAAGGFSTCFYITHKPECVSMADHVLRFRRGGVEIQ